MVMGVGGARSLSVILTLQDRFSKQMKVARAEVDRFGQTTARTTKELDKGFKQNEQSVSKFLLALRRNFLAVTAVIGAGIGLAAMFISASRDHARSITILDGALQALGTSWDEQRIAIEGLLTVLGNSTGASDATMIGALVTLIRETGNLDYAMKLLPASLGLAARSGLDVGASAQLIADALKGDKGAVTKLAELGLNLGTAATEGEKLKEVLEFTAGWAEKNNDAVSQLNQKWQEMKRIVGEELTPVLEPLLDLMIQLAPAVTAMFEVLVMQLQLVLAPLLALQGTIKSVRKLLGLNEDTPVTKSKVPLGADSGFTSTNDVWGGSGNPALEIGQQTMGPFPDPWSHVTEGDSGGVAQGMSVTIVSNGDLDFERRVREQLDSIYRQGWRPNS